MSTPLSSRWTPFYKFIVPSLVFGGMGYGAWLAYVHPERQKLPPGIGPDYAWLTVVAIAGLVGVILWWALAALKHVELDNDELIVSNYRTEIRVPLAAVEKISGASLSNPPRYTITFAEPTEFGRRITFLAPMRWTLIRLGEPDEVVELRGAWDAARHASAERR